MLETTKEERAQQAQTCAQVLERKEINAAQLSVLGVEFTARLCRDVDTLEAALRPQEDMGDDDSPTGVFRCPVCRQAAEEGQSIDHEEGCLARAVLG